MNNTIKNILGIAGTLVILVVAAAIGIGVYAYSKSLKPTSFRTFSVSGEGKVVAVPDVAQFTFSVITEGGSDIAALQKENTEKVNRAISFLKGKGVEAKDIKTQNYDVSPQYQYFQCFRPGPCPPPKIVGYTITQTVLVKARDFSKVGELLGGVVEHGSNSVSGLTFTLDEPQKVENEARAKAIAEAYEKAEVMAKAGKFRIGRLISIQEGGRGPIPILYERGAVALDSEDGGAPPPAIEAGSQDVIVQVTLQYEIK